MQQSSVTNGNIVTQLWIGHVIINLYTCLLNAASLTIPRQQNACLRLQQLSATHTHTRLTALFPGLPG